MVLCITDIFVCDKQRRKRTHMMMQLRSFQSLLFRVLGDSEHFAHAMPTIDIEKKKKDSRFLDVEHFRIVTTSISSRV